MNMRLLIALLMIMLLAFSQSAAVLAEPGKKLPDSVKQLVLETKKSIETVDMDEFKKVLDSKAYDVIIDVREPAEYASGHIPGAINVPRGVIEFKVWKYIGLPGAADSAKRTYIYCKGGSRCALATHTLQKLGARGVVAVDMKIKNWKKAGYPLTEPAR